MILGISCDTPEENRLFKEKFDFPFDLLSDQDRRVSMAYGAADEAEAQYPNRISYLLDPEGIVRRVYAQVDPGQHPEEVLRDLV